MEVYRVHVSANLPGYEVWGGSEYYLRARWATDPALLTEPPSAVLLPSNYYETPLVWVAWELTPLHPIVLQPGLAWWTSLKPNLRNLYCQIDYRYESSNAWIFFRDAIFIVNHDPVANTGPPQQIEIGISGDVLGDIRLDARGSVDADLTDPVTPDPGPLHYSWALENAPVNVDSTSLAYTLATTLPPINYPIFLPRGTIVEPHNQGVYQFKLTVTDNDVADIGIFYGLAGKDDAVTTVAVMAPPPNLTITSPTNAAPSISNAVVGGGTRIVYWIGNSAATSGSLGGAWMLRLVITQARNWAVSLNPVPVGTVVHEATRIDPQLHGNFFWNGSITNPNPALNGRTAEGTFHVRLELLDRFSNATADPTTVVSENECIVTYATRAQQLCAQMLNIPNIGLANFHSSGNVDGAFAQNNVQDVAAGGQASRSAYGNAPGGTTGLDPNMLQCLIDASGYWAFLVTEIAGGSHSPASLHYAGRAFDIGTINGAIANAANAACQPFMNFCAMQGAVVLGPVPPPGNPGHATHIHAHW